jgi:hypothetical protein
MRRTLGHEAARRRADAQLHRAAASARARAGMVRCKMVRPIGVYLG